MSTMKLHVVNTDLFYGSGAGLNGRSRCDFLLRGFGSAADCDMAAKRIQERGVTIHESDRCIHTEALDVAREDMARVEAENKELKKRIGLLERLLHLR